MKTLAKAWQKVEEFFFTPASPRPLGVLRIGVAAVLLLQVYMLRSSALDFLGSGGIVQGELADYLRNPTAPSVSWVSAWLGGFGIGETTSIFLCCSLYIMSLVLLLFGFYTRTAAVVAWFLHWMLISTSETTTYGIDLYAHVFLFYLIWVPAGAAYSLDLLLGRVRGDPSVGARLGLRVTQLHLCITYFCSAIEKAQGIQWWNGELLWRALNLPEYRQFDLLWLADWPWLLRLGGWGSLALEFGYVAMIWPKRTRRLWVAGIVGLHLGIAVFLGLVLFGLIMCVLTLAVFGLSAEPETAPATTVRYKQLAFSNDMQ